MRLDKHRLENGIFNRQFFCIPNALRNLMAYDALDDHSSSLIFGIRLERRRVNELRLITHVATGEFLSGMDWAKLGEFIRNNGTWNGKELIQRDLMSELLNAITSIFDRAKVKEILVAAGDGKQRLDVLPNESMVVVRFGNSIIFRDDAFFKTLLDASKKQMANIVS